MLEQVYSIGFGHMYLARALVPMSSAFPDTLFQKALTAALSLAVRLVILLVDLEVLNAVFSPNCGVFMSETEYGHTQNLHQDRLWKAFQLSCNLDEIKKNLVIVTRERRHTTTLFSNHLHLCMYV